jgi:NADP-dependent 3-hydroxy acid dehydrogenase YdfG
MAETSLIGRTALVTGASRGIGRAVAASLASAGARVWGLARDAQKLETLSRETGVTPLVVDLGDDEETWLGLDGLADQIGGAPDILVSCAGVFGIEPFVSETVKGFDAHLEVNLRAPFLAVRAVLPGMLERGSGLIVNVGSVAGRRAFPGNTAYSASKFGLRGMHEVLREELRGSGVSCTLIEPAATDTELWDPLDPDSDPALPDRSSMLRPEAVAEAVLFVATRPPEVCVPLLQIERG